jgi:Staphylococcal nuclease homologue
VPCATNWRTSGNAPVLRTTHDKYTRTLGDVFLRDGTHVNHTLVKDGWCWWYRKYAPVDTVLEGLEKDARETEKAYGLIHTPCRRGSGGRSRRKQRHGAQETQKKLPPPHLPGGRVPPCAVGSTLSSQRKASRMGNKDKETRERAFRDKKEVLTEWTCHYCPEVATTIRQGAAVCWQHAISLRGVGWS